MSKPAPDEQLVADDPFMRPAREVVRDQRLGFEHDLIVDRYRHDRDRTRDVDRGAEEAELDRRLDLAGSAAGAARKHDRVVATCDELVGVDLNDAQVQPVASVGIQAVGAESAHDRREQPVAKDVLARGVRERRHARAPEDEAEHDRVQVRRVGRCDDQRRARRELAHGVETAFDHHARAERAAAERSAECPRQQVDRRAM